MKPHQIAPIVHAAHRAFQEFHVDAEVAGPWEEASQHTRDILIEGIEGMIDGETPESSHERWRANKAAAGWTWGPVKDSERKQHPCMVPYEQLMEHEQTKDQLMYAIVHTLKGACH